MLQGKTKAIIVNKIDVKILNKNTNTNQLQRESLSSNELMDFGPSLISSSSSFVKGVSMALLRVGIRLLRDWLAERL